ncbi:MAG: malate dehydrogenase [Planctomycetes bacterium]|nr:malate dehydrogenase [Planctomycetota bacterium]
MGRNRIGVVGAGFVGATLAQRLADAQLGDVVLSDIKELDGMPQGKALDIMETGPIVGSDARMVGTTAVEDMKDCDVIVITAGLARKPGMTREDLIDKNAGILRGVVERVSISSPNAILIVVTNPLDVMAYLAYKVSKFPKNRVVGMAGVLDAARFAFFIAEKLNCSSQDVRAMVLGSHGDTMVPLPRFTSVWGVPITELLSEEAVEQLVNRTRDGGAEIVKLLKQGSAYYAPSQSVLVMVQSILRDEKRLLPACAVLDGEYGLKDIMMGVPVILGRTGVERVVELRLRPEELKMFKDSAAKVAEGTRHMKLA